MSLPLIRHKSYVLKIKKPNGLLSGSFIIHTPAQYFSFSSISNDFISLRTVILAFPGIVDTQLNHFYNKIIGESGCFLDSKKVTVVSITTQDKVVF